MDCPPDTLSGTFHPFATRRISHDSPPGRRVVLGVVVMEDMIVMTDIEEKQKGEIRWPHDV